jgi:hypothetical protein
MIIFILDFFTSLLNILYGSQKYIFWKTSCNRPYIDINIYITSLLNILYGSQNIYLGSHPLIDNDNIY